MADQRTMAELLRAPTDGYAEAIMVPSILAEHFELKHSLINMMTSDQFFGLKKENPHDQIRWFNKITSTIKYKDHQLDTFYNALNPSDQDSLNSAAGGNLLERRTQDVLTIIENKSKTSVVTTAVIAIQATPPTASVKAVEEICVTYDGAHPYYQCLAQKFDESFHEAWERYKDLLRACPHHGFTELHQLDTFYNALNPADQDSLNATAGGNLFEKNPQDALTIIENKSKIRNSQSKPIASTQTSAVTTAMMAMLKQFQSNPPPAQVKAVEEIYVTCGGAHPYYQCLAAGGNTFLEYRDNIQGYVSVATGNFNQGNP
nr:hypothetical protein [Tanacetum cinerariifolium]